MSTNTQRRGSNGNARTRRSGTFSYIVLVAFAVFFVVATLLWALPIWVLGLYLVASLAAFCVYAIDKSAAKAGGWRVPESTLHLLGVLGGWPGAIIAQQTMRHKTQKLSFRRMFWLSVVVNIVVFVLLATPEFAQAATAEFTQ